MSAQNKAYDTPLAVQVSSILHGTPQSVLHRTFWFLATSPNFADLGGGGGHGPFDPSDVRRRPNAWSLAAPLASPSRRVGPASGYTRRRHRALPFGPQRASAAFPDGCPMRYPGPEKTC